ncbi:MAG TPA: helix-turn-helix transcriptional regulator [Candidatus Binatia bacterium]|nr:helix-turn-helix transcriptional regulator [Candidatus Binatia bacterium]
MAPSGARGGQGRVRSRLSVLMGERRVRIIDVARATGISRNMLAKLYYDRARRIDLDDLAALCAYFGCGVGDLLEAAPAAPQPADRRGRRRTT